MESSTVLSWTAFTCVSGALVCYYTGGTKYIGKLFASSPIAPGSQQQGAGSKKRQNQQNARRKDAASRTVAPVIDTISSATEAVTTSAKNLSNTSNTKKRKAVKAPSKSSSVSPATQSQPESEESDAEEQDADWAKQLAAAQTGVSLEKSSGKAALKKKAKEQEDLSKSAPQAVQTTSAPMKFQPEKARPAGDVSDMLEKPASGPSIIKITGEYQEKKQKAPKAPEIKESKKQRQNRRKVEERAAQREADETARRQLEESQRRSAREARGEPAKNGLEAANAPKTSAWAAGANGASERDSRNDTSALTNGNTQLLDTFDHDAASNSSNDGANTDVTTPATNASAHEDIPSEDAQLQMLAEMSGWNEVGGNKKKKAKGKATPSSASSEAGSRAGNATGNLSTSELTNGTSRASTPVMKQPPITKPAASSAPSSKGINGYAALGLLNENTTPVKHQGHPDDSEWAP